MRFEDAYGDWQSSRLTQEEAARLLGVYERTFRRYIDRYEDAGLEGLIDKRLSQVSHRRAPVDEMMELVGRYIDGTLAIFHGTRLLARYDANGQELDQIRQADELRVKRVSKCVWMAMALAVPTRLWLGGVISPRRDRALITALVQKVRACARSLAILVCVDGLASYITPLFAGVP